MILFFYIREEALPTIFRPVNLDLVYGFNDFTDLPGKNQKDSAIYHALVKQI